MIFHKFVNVFVHFVEKIKLTKEKNTLTQQFYWTQRWKNVGKREVRVLTSETFQAFFHVLKIEISFRYIFKSIENWVYKILKSHSGNTLCTSLSWAPCLVLLQLHLDAFQSQSSFRKKPQIRSSLSSIPLTREAGLKLSSHVSKAYLKKKCKDLELCFAIFLWKEVDAASLETII